MDSSGFLMILFYGMTSAFFFLKRESKILSNKKSIIFATIVSVFAVFLGSITTLINKDKIDIITTSLAGITNFYFVYNLASSKLSINKFIKSIATILIFLSSSIYKIIPIRFFGITEKLITPKLSTYLTVFSDCVVLIILLLLYYDDIKEGLLKAKKNFNEFFDTSFKIWLFGFLGMVISNLAISLIFPVATPGNENAVQGMIDTSPVVMLICAGIVAPIIEELTFRQAFKDIFKNKWIFILVSGIIFGGLHVVFAYKNLIDFVYIIPYSILGISFAYMLDKTNNVMSSIMMHFIHNTAIIMFSILTGMILI